MLIRLFHSSREVLQSLSLQQRTDVLHNLPSELKIESTLIHLRGPSPPPKVDPCINHRGQIRGYLTSVEPVPRQASEFQFAVDVKDLVLLQELLASRDSHARDGMRGEAAADGFVRKGAMVQTTGTSFCPS